MPSVGYHARSYPLWFDIRRRCLSACTARVYGAYSVTCTIAIRIKDHPLLGDDAVHLGSLALKADPSRTVIRPFFPEDPVDFAIAGHPRVRRIADRVLAMSDEQVRYGIARLIPTLSQRHRHAPLLANEVVVRLRHRPMDDECFTAIRGRAGDLLREAIRRIVYVPRNSIRTRRLRGQIDWQSKLHRVCSE
jgi:hypothetical protein